MCEVPGLRPGGGWEGRSDWSELIEFSFSSGWMPHSKRWNTNFHFDTIWKWPPQEKVFDFKKCFIAKTVQHCFTWVYTMIWIVFIKFLYPMYFIRMLDVFLFSEIQEQLLLIHFSVIHKKYCLSALKQGCHFWPFSSDIFIISKTISTT